MQYHEKKLHLHNLKICRMIILMNFSRGLSIWPGVMCRGCRPLSSHQGITEVMSVAELCRGGGVTQRSLTTEDIIRDIPNKIPIRDLRLLLRRSSSNVKKIPALLPRPSSNCYILDIEHIRVLCFPEKVGTLSIDIPSKDKVLKKIAFSVFGF